MCDACKDPNDDPAVFVEQIRERLRDRRYLVKSVGGSRDSAEFSYTIGLTAHGLHELIVMGRRHDEAQTLLKIWGDYVLDESLVLPGETLGTGPFVLEAVAVERPDEHLVLAHSLFGPAVRALQLVWADERGRWPWEPGHRARRSGQPVLGGAGALLLLRAPAGPACDPAVPRRRIVSDPERLSMSVSGVHTGRSASPTWTPLSYVARSRNAEWMAATG